MGSASREQDVSPGAPNTCLQYFDITPNGIQESLQHCAVCACVEVFIIVELRGLSCPRT